MNCNYDKEERFDSDTLRALGEHYEAILKLLGEDPAREGLLKTPERVAKAMCFLTKGYDEDPREILLSAKFKEEYRQMVIVKDIELYSLCEHHMLPFYGKAHVAYIPAAIGLWAARLLGLATTQAFLLGRLMTFACYAALTYFACKRLRSGKMVLATCALVPTAVFLASGYSYDFWLIGFLMLGFAALTSCVSVMETLVANCMELVITTRSAMIGQII